MQEILIEGTDIQRNTLVHHIQYRRIRTGEAFRNHSHVITLCDEMECVHVVRDGGDHPPGVAQLCEPAIDWVRRKLHRRYPDMSDVQKRLKIHLLLTHGVV